MKIDVRDLKCPGETKNGEAERREAKLIWRKE